MKKQIFKVILLTTIIGLGCKKNPTTTPSATITALNCTAATFSSVLTNGVQTTGVNITIPYTGGNGGTYSAISISSTGVTGLTATASAGNVASGNGNLVLTLNGTPTNSGTANFLINLGGKSCTASATVNATVGTATVTSISCGSATMTGTLKENNLVTNIPLSIPYIGGNGGTYSAISITSTGVTGITATATAGNLVSGNGNLNLLLNGTPTSSGTISFTINIGSSSCTVSKNVAPVNGFAFANLDCINSSTTGSLMEKTSASGVNITIPYTSGNGGTYNSGSFNSTGVTGLTASYPAGSVLNGNGNLNLQVTGTPAGKGVATFPIQLNSTLCYININVQKAPVTKSLIENSWWYGDKTKTSPIYYFKSNGVFYHQKITSYLDTGTWTWLSNDTVQVYTTRYQFRKLPIDRITTDSLIEDYSTYKMYYFR